MKKLITLITCFIILSSINAQNEGNVWCFGRGVGIDFNSGVAVPFANTNMVSNEGNATVCDVNGNLLFYTNGVEVWNKNNVVMPNGSGLKGDRSSTQSSLIVKKPGSNTIYYLFTTDNVGGRDGLSYSEVDISLNGGLGDVNSNKNVFLVSPTCEKVTAIRHKNGVDVWIVTHLSGNNTFRSYLLSSTGLNASFPVNTNIGVSVILNTTQVGYLKASRDGSRIAVAHTSMDVLEVFDFNNVTGRLSNKLSFTGFGPGGVYGVEFSPNGDLLYVQEKSVSTPTNIFQFNLLAGSQAAINNSKMLVGVATQYGGALQSAPDGKIYHSNLGANTLDVINNPNVLGIGCNFALAPFSFPGNDVLLGLPNFINDIYNPTFSAINLCFGDLTQFTMATTTNVTSVLWNFDDPASGALNTSTNFAPGHQFTSSGTYNVRLTVFIFGNPRTTTIPIFINPTPSINLGNDTTLCTGDVMTLNATSAGVTAYVWQDGSANATFNVNRPGTYSVEVTNGICPNKDTIVVYYNALPVVSLGNDTTLCPTQTALLDATFPNSTYTWQDNSIGATFSANQPGTYWVEASNRCGRTRDTIDINFTTSPLVNLGNDTVLCDGQNLQLDASFPKTSYTWQDNSTASTYNVTNQGLFWVNATNKCGTTIDSVNVGFISAPMVDFGNDTVLCDGQNLLLDATNSDATYLWQDNSTDSTFNVSQTGTYRVEVVNKCGNTKETIDVSYIFPPLVNLGNDTTLCYGQDVILDASASYATYFWQDGSTDSTFNVTQQGTYWVDVINKCGSATDTIDVIYYPMPVVDLGNDTAICLGENIFLNSAYPNATYLWQDGSTDSTFNVIDLGVYWVKVFEGCTVFDTLVVTEGDCEFTISIPNVFTPNADGQNDLFQAIINKTTFNMERLNFDMTILNRWGHTLFETNRITDGWEGRTASGVESPQGVYYYIIHFKSEEYKGSVTLLR